MRTPSLERAFPHIGGDQRIYRFANNYGASVVRHSFSYGNEIGLWELAVIQFHGEGLDDWSLTYETPITDDVLGRLDEGMVDDVLALVEMLPRVEVAA